ncbi:CheR family methyltransferase [Myxococcota bacterium]
MTSASGFGVRPRLRPAEFRLLRDLVNEYAGLQFDDDSMYAFDRRLGERVADLALNGFDEYYKYLRFDSSGQGELEEAVELLITPETYFFRQEYQLRAFQDEVLPMLAQLNANRRRLTVWSAGCSTGEEAYTLAILVHESGLFKGWDVRVLGSDLSRRNVATARRGVYRSGSFRATSPEQRAAYFAATPEGWQVVDTFRKLCYFGQLNLLDGQRGAIVGRVDAVFCRNVLIYFDVRSRRRVIDNLYDRLAPGGYLMLGHSESLLNVTTAFELVHLKQDLVYRKPRGAERWNGARQ